MARNSVVAREYKWALDKLEARTKGVVAYDTDRHNSHLAAESKYRLQEFRNSSLVVYNHSLMEIFGSFHYLTKNHRKRKRGHCTRGMLHPHVYFLIFLRKKSFKNFLVRNLQKYLLLYANLVAFDAIKAAKYESFVGLMSVANVLASRGANRQIASKTYFRPDIVYSLKWSTVRQLNSHETLFYSLFTLTH